MDNALHGSCACGRNQYVVEIPSTSTRAAQVLLDNSSLNRKLLSIPAPFTAWLRVPLSWYSSSAHSLFPDETPQSIRRTFVSPESRSHARRQFCGYCGTPLSTWEERTREDADYISITLGSLLEDSVSRLEEMGLMGGEDEEEDQGGPVVAAASTGNRSSLFAPLQVPRNRGAPWFESLIEDGRLGRIKRNRGGYTSADGSVREEWEVVEWTGDSDEGVSAAGNGKRKFGQGEGTTDVSMSGA
ncbi:hypothetical protein K490DRAFT_34659 [Saccharata proteae CBS 121410]|uniref:CENP-V/GFA domain-containing protein n=1 Tax=Saccharata proteae CBS 121410 TaxID=1314787 RepID=A0A9P4I194_9PEZI|nr:hypothetical protein K490DRAFT_34659 [Saccharata proteae CBS 121410]